jgi:hypothetical protein
MAMVAARAAIQAAKKRKQLIMKAQSVLQHDLDPKERAKLVGTLREYPETNFLANLVDGTHHNSPAIFVCF